MSDLNRSPTDPGITQDGREGPKPRFETLVLENTMDQGQEDEPTVKFSLGGGESSHQGGGLGTRIRKMSRKFSIAMMPPMDLPAASLTHGPNEHDLLLEPLFTGQAIHVGDYPDSPINRTKELVDEDDLDIMQTHPVFCEMMELAAGDTVYPDSDTSTTTDMIWKESARWVKYEETVEEGGTRFSKPHVTLLTIQNILQLRNCLKRGATLFDIQAGTFKKLVDTIVHCWTIRHELPQLEFENMERILLAPKHHLLRNRLRQLSGTESRGSRLFDDGIEIDEHQMSVHSISAAPAAVSAPSKVDQSLMRKLPLNSEAAVILVGHVPQLSQPLTEFVRLRNAQFFPDLPELPIPVRFLFILFVSQDHYKDEATKIGRCMGSLLVDDIFSQVAYRAKDAHALMDGVEEFLSQTVIVPPAKWNPICRWEPQEDMPATGRTVGKIVTHIDDHKHGHLNDNESGLRRTGRPFGGLVQDIRRKIVWYPSDFVDACRGRITQTLAAAIFLFFANVTKIITFGGVMGNMLNNNMATEENLLSGGISGVIYALFSGQPLCVLSATGPTLVFEAILYDLCYRFGWDYLPARFWVGVWTAGIILVLVALDASVFVALITRFTEEAFATLISIIFIVQAFEELWELKHHAPVTTNPQELLADPCMCNTSTMGTVRVLAGSKFTIEDCAAVNGTAAGQQCTFEPDVFMFSIILFFGTFSIAIGLKMFRNSGFLPSKIRQSVADFGVFTAIVLMTTLNYFVGLNVPSLHVPSEFKPTLDRGWLVDPMGVEHWWIALIAFFPALFFTILVVMDQQITSVIINRPDNKLLKGCGYHLDLLIVALLMVVCASMGIPFYVAATVISIMHVDSLRLMSESAAPGEKPTFLGVKEQRVTALLAHILIGLSVVLTPVIKLVPMPVLLGIFLYMGVVSLSGQQFVQRITVLFMPMKYQPDYPWLRVVHLKRVHLFTAIQCISLVLLFIVKYTKLISMLFPVMLILMIITRKFMDRIFSHKELLALDDPLPTCAELLKTKTTRTKKLVPLVEEQELSPKMGSSPSEKLVTFSVDPDND